MTDVSPHLPDSNPELHSVQSILLARERERLQQLEWKLESLRGQAQSQHDALQEQIRDLVQEIKTLRQTDRANEDRVRDLHVEVQLLRRQAQSDSQGLVERLKPVFSDLVGRQIRDSRDEMAEALAPVMGEAIRLQIRDSRNDMVEALYPVIGETVQKAIAEFAREFQRNIDARIRAAFGPAGFMRTAWARARGVSPSELVLRDSLPFSIREIFLIQRGSGLLLAHSHPGSAEVADSDLIGGMLTAIRDFVRDSFGQGQEEKDLDEIQYGDQRIIVQSGRAAYLAVVTTGVEPAGFRAHLHQFISELHVRYENALREYNGDPTSLPNLQPKIARLIVETTGATRAERKPPSRMQRLLIVGSVLAGIALIWLACFYTHFTIALLPVAFPGPPPTQTYTPTPTATVTPTPTRTNTPTSTPVPTRPPTRTPTPTVTPTATNTSTPTPTPSPTFTPTSLPTPSRTPTPVAAWAIGNVWVHPAPSFAEPFIILRIGTPVTVLTRRDGWVEIRWFEELPPAAGWQRGWVDAQWIAVR